MTWRRVQANKSFLQRAICDTYSVTEISSGVCCAQFTSAFTSFSLFVLALFPLLVSMGLSLRPRLGLVPFYFSLSTASSCLEGFNSTLIVTNWVVFPLDCPPQTLPTSVPWTLDFPLPPSSLPLFPHQN